MTNQSISSRGSMRMTSDRLNQILEAYGGAPAGWPEDERSAALALIAASPQARAMQEAALGLDGIMDELTPPGPSSELIARLEAAGRRGAVRHLRALSKSADWLRSFSLPFGPQQWAPAALSLAGVALVVASLFLIDRGDEIEAPRAGAAASNVSARDYLSNLPLVDVASTDLSAEDSSTGERFAVLISARETAFALIDDPDASTDPWTELLSEDAQESGFQLSAVPLSGLPLE